MIDLIGFGFSCLIMLAYFGRLRWHERKFPNSAVHKFNARVREQWVRMVAQSANKDILAVQTLRNSMMAANFMASTAVLLIIGVLNLSEKIGHWELDRHLLVPPDAIPNDFWQIKLGLLLLDFFVAFYCFSMSIRFYNHAGYMINLLPEQGEKGDQAMVTRTLRYLHKAGGYYAFGNRTFYFSLPVIFWFFGVYFLIVGTVLLIVALASLDHPPR
jgi:uncharacterized membrane protein